MQAKIILILLLFLSIGTSQLSYGQEPADTTGKELKLVVKHDGVEYIGYILSDDGREVLLYTRELGMIYIRKEGIHSITTIEPLEINKGGLYDPSGVFTTRYYFTNNALPVKKRDNYAMVHLYGPEVHFAAGKGFTGGIMTTWGFSPLIAAFKQSIKTNNPKLNFSIGTMIGSSGYLNTFRGWGGMHWATATIGSPKNNLSISAGYLYVQPGFNDREVAIVDDGFYPMTYTQEQIFQTNGTSKLFKTPMFSLAGIWKVGKRASFIFDSMAAVFNDTQTELNIEPYVWVDGNGNGMHDGPTEEFWEVSTKTTTETTTMFFLMPGMRFQKTDRRAFQVALAGVTYIRGSETIAFPVPMCSWFFKI